MKGLFKKLGVIGALLSILIIAACGGNDTSEEQDTASYPEQDINGIIMWGEGGATDIIARTIAPLAEEQLDTSLVMQNRAGAAGAIASQYVYDQPADGYTLLFGAENPNLYQIYDISERSYTSDFKPISIFASSYAGIVVKEDSEFQTLEDLVTYAQENPNDLVMGTTGEGGITNVVLAMLNNELDTEFTTVPYDGEGPVATALLGDQVDVTAVTISAAQEYVESGDFRMLAVVNDEPVNSIPDVRPITDAYPQFKDYLPWGPFQGVFVHKDTPENIVEKLTKAFEVAQNKESFQTALINLGLEPLNLSGDEAMQYVKDNQSTSTWMLYDAGEAEISPEEFDIPRIDE